MQRIILIASIAFLSLSSCKKGSSLPPIDDNVDLDGKILNDSSLIKPADYLLSAAIPNPTTTDLSKPVVITVHGFSACNFEWTEFRDWSKTKNDFYVSLVLLGGHGRDYEDFKNGTWQDWQQPVIDEYNLLRSKGYQNISFLASSTGCPLVLDVISSKKIPTDVLKHVFLIDPIVVPSNKLLSLVSAVGPVLRYTKTNLDPGENGFWYKYRPYEALKQLEELCRKERKELEKGVTFPSGVSLRVYKVKHDDAADPVSAVIIQKGVSVSVSPGVETVIVNSNLHVFTRLHGRATFSTEDVALQLKTFEEIHSAL